MSKGRQPEQPPPVRGFRVAEGRGDKRKWYGAVGARGRRRRDPRLRRSRRRTPTRRRRPRPTRRARTRRATVEKDRADGLDKALTQLKQDKADEDKQLAALSGKAADVDKKAEQLAAEEKKLQGDDRQDAGLGRHRGRRDPPAGSSTRCCSRPATISSPTSGKAVLDKVAVALKDLPDKQVWVQGHTDDQPIYIPPPKKDPKAKPLPKGAKPPPPAPVKFITNWELSAARALQVVHYLQDTAKIDPTRLAALAFGQYRPVSRSNKAANRRIEIVLYPKRVELEKAEALAAGGRRTRRARHRSTRGQHVGHGSRRARASTARIAELTADIAELARRRRPTPSLASSSRIARGRSARASRESWPPRARHRHHRVAALAEQHVDAAGGARGRARRRARRRDRSARRLGLDRRRAAARDAVRRRASDRRRARPC